MAIGVVKWYNAKKGFGFITQNEGNDNRDVFVHYTRILGPDDKLKEGDAVEFEIEPGEIGPRAAKVIKKPADFPSLSD